MSFCASMAEVAAAPPPLGTNKVGYSADGKYVVLKRYSAAPAPRPQLALCPLARTALAERAPICRRGHKLIWKEAGPGRPVLCPPWR